jgi:NitT/TauT family transport system permease protein
MSAAVRSPAPVTGKPPSLGPRPRWVPSAETVRVFVLRVALIVVLLAIWQYFGSRSTHNLFFYSKPSAIWTSLRHLLVSSAFYTDLRYTMTETVLGFVIGGGLGIVAGFGLAFSRTAYRAVDPIMNALNALPRIALSSLFILWFGLGVESKVVLVTSLVFFPLFLNAYKGATTVDPDHTLLMHTLHASRWAYVRKVMFPSTAPWIITGAKLGVAAGLGGAVVGEIIAGQFGLGAALNADAQSFATGDEFAILLVLIAIAVVLNGIFSYFERRTSSWR